jgi:hypothetical protein
MERPESLVGVTDVIYMQLLDEGVDVWRPVSAVDIGDGRFRLLPTPDYDPEIETWEFLPGSIVAVESRRLSGGVVPVAVRAV